MRCRPDCLVAQLLACLLAVYLLADCRAEGLLGCILAGLLLLSTSDSLASSAPLRKACATGWMTRSTTNHSLQLLVLSIPVFNQIQACATGWMMRSTRRCTARHAPPRCGREQLDWASRAPSAGCMPAAGPHGAAAAASAGCTAAAVAGCTMRNKPLGSHASRFAAGRGSKPCCAVAGHASSFTYAIWLSNPANPKCKCCYFGRRRTSWRARWRCLRPSSPCTTPWCRWVGRHDAAIAVAAAAAAAAAAGHVCAFQFQGC